MILREKLEDFDHNIIVIILLLAPLLSLLSSFGLFLVKCERILCLNVSLYIHEIVWKNDTCYLMKLLSLRES